jgi:hypothetical protein
MYTELYTAYIFYSVGRVRLYFRKTVASKGPLAIGRMIDEHGALVE